MAGMFFAFCVFCVWSVRTVSAATECQDVAVVVVASVFGTLAVVLIVLAIVGFLLWKRRRDILKPAKLIDDPDKSTKDNLGYSNPAFDKDPEIGEAGSHGESGFKTNGSNKPIFPVDKDRKTWASLPATETQFARSRKGSTGSLDRNTYYGDDDLVSVCLTSQDFIGLGFNVAGSMRDGIFVSKVHNRGPAKDSGKFKVGDRILSIAISFENMVYEDALTILSYASPYPVKVTLQKQTEIPRNRKLSDIRTSLNHPLYRSQSVDTLQTIGKEPLFNPKRSNSEIRYEDADPSKRASRIGCEDNIIEETNAYLNNKAGNEDVFFETKPSSQAADVTVHRETENKGALRMEREVSIAIDTDIPTARLDLSTELTENNTAVFDSTEKLADPFQGLTEEDKMDVIRLSYDNPDDPEHFTPRSANTLQTEITPNSPLFGDQKTKPMKPERKKKRGSTTSGRSQSDDDLTDTAPSSPSSPVPIFNDNLVDDVMTASSLLPPLEAPPPVPEDEPEADEELIQPLQKERTVSIESNNIAFEPIDPSRLDVSGATIVADVSLMDDSFSDHETTLIKPPSPFTRPDSPDGVEIEEVMAATHVKREHEVPNIDKSGLDRFNKSRSPSTSSSSLPSSDSDADLKKEANAVIEESVTVDKVNVTETTQDSLPENSGHMDENDFEKDLPELDMDLGFDPNSVLFQERFPSRNEKENDGGMAFDISVAELESMEKKAMEEERVKQDNRGSKGGIAFEIRDDYTTGQTCTVNTNNVHRTASYELQTNTDKLRDHDISTQRPTSLKTEIKTRDELETGKLDWSGQRLVRSGSFSDIPQNNSIEDWTNQQNLSVDDALIEKHIREDSKSPILKKLTKATLIPGNSNMAADLSDSDSHCRSISSSSADSRDSSPARVGTSLEHTNGDDDGLGTSPETTPIKMAPVGNNKSQLIPTVTKYGDSDQAFTVTLNTAGDSAEEDC